MERITKQMKALMNEEIKVDEKLNRLNRKKKKMETVSEKEGT